MADNAPDPATSLRIFDIAAAATLSLSADELADAMQTLGLDELTDAAAKRAIEAKRDIPATRQLLLTSDGGESVLDALKAPLGTVVYLLNEAVTSWPEPAAGEHQPAEPNFLQPTENWPGTHANFARMSEMAGDLRASAETMRREFDATLEDQRAQLRGYAAVVANLHRLADATMQRTWKLDKEARECALAKNVFVRDTLERLPEERRLLQDMPILAEIGEGDLFDWLERRAFRGSYEIGFARLVAYFQLKSVERWARAPLIAMGASVQAVRQADLTTGDLEEKIGKAMRIARTALGVCCDVYDFFARQSENSREATSSDGQRDAFASDNRKRHCAWLEQSQYMHRTLSQVRVFVIKFAGETRERLRRALAMRARLRRADVGITACSCAIARIRAEVESFRAVRSAGETYVAAVAEVVRRRRFAEELDGRMADEVRAAYEAEARRREDFLKRYGGHLLVGELFAGLEETLPTLCGDEKPSATFDLGLPKLGVEHLEEVLKVYDGRELIPKSVIRAKEMMRAVGESE